jgi:hypothetical protein
MLCAEVNIDPNLRCDRMPSRRPTLYRSFPLGSPLPRPMDASPRVAPGTRCRDPPDPRKHSGNRWPRALPHTRSDTLDRYTQGIPPIRFSLPVRRAKTRRPTLPPRHGQGPAKRTPFEKPWSSRGGHAVSTEEDRLPDRRTEPETRRKCPALQESFGQRRRADGPHIPRHR